MKKNLLFLTALLFVSFLALSQNEPQDSENDKYLTQNPIKISKDKDYKGSHYFHDSFMSGTVFKGNKPVAVNVGIRYNAYRDEMEIKEKLTLPNPSAKILMKASNIHVRMGNEVFVYLPLKETGMKSGYFQVFYEGSNFNLYKKITKDFLEGFESANSYTRDVPAAYKQKENFYLHLKEEGKFVEMPGSKRKKLDTFGSLEKQVKKYTKENDLNINRESDLVKAVRYADGL